MQTPKQSSQDDRVRHRRTVLDCTALVDLLAELYPASSLPPLNATDREIGRWVGQRELIAGLVSLREEALKGTDGLPKVLGG